MELVKLESTMPLRAYIEEDLNRILLITFLPWLASLLSLTDETSAERLEIALPAIKQQCIGMGFNEIKKMFEMYVDSKLNLKPIPNYFDRILLGKIVDSYKALNKPKSKPNQELKMSEEDKEFIMLEAVDRIKKEVEQNGKIESNVIGVYMYLYSKNVLPEHTKEFKEKYTKLAIPIAKGEVASKATYSLDDHRKLKGRIESISQGKGELIKNIAKKLILTDYFKNK